MVTQSRRERFGAFEIEWSITVTGPSLELTYGVDASEEVFVQDRVWSYTSKYERVPDPYGVYRFVRDGSLRLVFAQAPWPPNLVPMIVYSPLYSRVLPGVTHRRTIRIALPVEEYSSLAFAEEGTALEEVKLVRLVMGYRLRSTLEADPEPPINETAEGAGYVTDSSDLAISALEVAPIPVLRRTGYIARFALPGEPPPEPFVPPAPEEEKP